MGRYGVRERVESGEPLYHLLDEQAALEATVWPALGCQCVGLTANWNGVDVDFLTSPPDLASFRSAPLYFGNPGRPVICIEPYTCVTDAFNLESRGVDAGMDVLPPGQEWRAEVHYIPRLHS